MAIPASAAYLLLPLTDSVMRAPTLGCIFLSIAAALVGVFALLRKEALIGEVVSHAAYPGIILGALFSSFFFGFENQHDFFFLLILFFTGGLTAFLSLLLIDFMQRKLAIASDASLCFVLALFFGIAITLVSQMQFSHPSLYRYAQFYLFGQTATIRDSAATLYGAMAAAVATFIAIFYKELRVITFDLPFSTVIGLPVRLINALFCLLLISSIIVGINAVGVVLMSAMLLAPAIAARQCCSRLSSMLFTAAAIGALSGYLGSFFSMVCNDYLALYYPSSRFSIPTGPAIVLVASSICIFTLAFAPKRGAFFRWSQKFIYRLQLLQDNIITRAADYRFLTLSKEFQCSRMLLFLALCNLYRKKWVAYNKQKGWHLTALGRLEAIETAKKKALWACYLTGCPEGQAPLEWSL